MNEIISLKQKRHQKELKYERKMLRELSLTDIKGKLMIVLEALIVILKISG